MSQNPNLPAGWDIPATGGRSLWVFAVDLTEDDAASLARDGAALAQALGVAEIDLSHIELVLGEDFIEYGFARYLSEGHGIALEQLRQDAITLDQLRGPLLLVYRPAFAPGNGQIAPKAPLRLIGRYAEPAPEPHIEMPDYAAAQGEVSAVSKRKPSDAAISGRIATLVLAFLALFVFVFIWIAK